MKGAFAALAAIVALPASGALAADLSGDRLVEGSRHHSCALLSGAVDL